MELKFKRLEQFSGLLLELLKAFPAIRKSVLLQCSFNFVMEMLELVGFKVVDVFYKREVHI